MSSMQKEKDYVSDYYNKYPVLRYIMPSFTLNGKNVTHRVLMLKQAMWALVQILNTDDGKLATALATGGDVVVNAAVDLTKADLQLLSAMLQLAKATFDGTNRVANVKQVQDAINSTSDVNTSKNVSSISDYATLLDVLNTPANKLGTNKVASLKALADSAVNKAELENLDNLTVAKLDVVLGKLNAYKPGADGKLSGVADLGALVVALNTEVSACGEQFKAEMNAAITASGAASSDVAVANGVKVAKEFAEKMKARRAAYDKNLTLLNTMKFASYSGATFNLSNLPALLNRVAFLDSILEANGEIYLIAHASQKSFTNSLNPLDKSASSGSTDSFQFVQNPNGLFLLRKNGKDFDYTKEFANLVDKDYCRAFGSSKTDANDNVNCGVMIADCLGEDTHDQKRCVANFTKVAKPSKHLRGWNDLSAEDKKYYAYRVLLGFGIAGKLNKDGNHVYAENGVPVYDDALLKEMLGNTSVTDDHLNYVKSLMKLLGVIENNKPKSNNPRPALNLQHAPANVPTIQGQAISFPGMGMMGMGAMGAMGQMRPMFGGASQTYESEIQSIQYGGGMEDAGRIVASVENKLNHPLAANYPADKKAYINKRLGDLKMLAGEIDRLEKTVISYIALASTHGTKDIVFTDLDIENFQRELKAKQTKMVAKIDGFQRFFVVNSLGK